MLAISMHHENASVRQLRSPVQAGSVLPVRLHNEMAARALGMKVPKRLMKRVTGFMQQRLRLR